jgi:ketosteroid isomerase-like protein
MSRSDSPLDTGREAFEHFRHGLATGEWDDFLAMLTDDFVFYFPMGPYQGRNEGKERAREFFDYVSAAFDEGLEVTLDTVLHNETTVMFEFRDEGTLHGEPYQNRVAVAFDVRGDKICGYREYFGLTD